MKKADLIISNGCVLTLDGANRIIDNGALCVRDGRIDELGPAAEITIEATKHLDAHGGLILPGLINGHTHAAMTLFRGLADDLPLMDWLQDYIFPVERRMDAGFVHTGALLACAEMILAGTTTFCDMYLFEDQVAQAADQAGMRCLAGEVLFDFPSPNYGPVENGLRHTQWLIDKWRGHPRVSIAVKPHSPYTCSAGLLEQAARLARDNHVPLIIHLAETLHEVAQVENRQGLRPVAYLHSLGLMQAHLVANHCVHLDGHDMDLLAAHGVKVIYNPHSNMKLASGIAPVPELQARGITVGLGTDGCASNNTLDLFAEMDVAAKLSKVHTLDPTVMDALTVLRMATIENARALGISDRVGSLEPGKRADIIVVDTRKPHLTPMYSPYSHLVYAATGGDVSHCVIDGRVVMEDRRLLTLDVDAVMAAGRALSRRVKHWTSR